GRAARLQPAPHRADLPCRRSPAEELRRRLHVHAGRPCAAAPVPRARRGRRDLLRRSAAARCRERRGPRPHGGVRPGDPGRHHRRGVHGRCRAEAEPGAVRPRVRRLGARVLGAGARRAAAGRADRDAPVPVRDVRRAVPRLGPGAPSGGGLLVHRQGRRCAGVPGGEVPAAGRLDAPRPAAPVAPGRDRPRAEGHLRLDRQRVRRRAGPGAGRGVRAGPGRHLGGGLDAARALPPAVVGDAARRGAHRGGCLGRPARRGRAADGADASAAAADPARAPARGGRADRRGDRAAHGRGPPAVRAGPPGQRAGRPADLLLGAFRTRSRDVGADPEGRRRTRCGVLRGVRGGRAVRHAHAAGGRRVRVDGGPRLRHADHGPGGLRRPGAGAAGDGAARLGVRLHHGRQPELALVGARAAADLAASASRRRAGGGGRDADVGDRLRAADGARDAQASRGRHLRGLHGQRDLGRRHPPAPGARGLPAGVRDRREAGRRRHDGDRVLHRGPERRGHARRGRSRCRGPVADHRVRAWDL
ncbi:MAG: Prophage Clp protease-like protein, partial [uncultured Nocardioides sp.]